MCVCVFEHTCTCVFPHCLVRAWTQCKRKHGKHFWTFKIKHKINILQSHNYQVPLSLLPLRCKKCKQMALVVLRTVNLFIAAIQITLCKTLYFTAAVLHNHGTITHTNTHVCYMLGTGSWLIYCFKKLASGMWLTYFKMVYLTKKIFWKYIFKLYIYVNFY